MISIPTRSFHLLASWFTFSTLLCLLALSALAQTPELPEEPSSAGANQVLLEALVKQNSAARVTMQDYHVKYSLEEDRIERGKAPLAPGDKPKVDRTVQVEGEIWRKDALYHQILTVQTLPLLGEELRTEYYEAVLNEKYFAWFVNGNFRVYNFENIASLYPPVDTHAKAWPRYDVLRYGLALDFTTFEEMYDACGRAPDTFKWSIHKEVVAEEKMYRIGVSRVRKSDEELQPPQAIGEFIIHPTRGFLSPRFVWFAKDGSIQSDANVHLEKSGNGYWYPASGIVIQENGDRTITFQVVSIEVGGLGEPFHFAMESMRFDHENTRMDEFFPDGREPEIKGYHNGSWIPVHLLPEEKRNQIMGPSPLKPNAPTGKGERDEEL